MGAHEIVGCIPGDEENTQEVQTFGTYTSDLAGMGDWFQTKGITSVAMESTGVYWMPVFEYLESLGIECCLISAALKKVPGRKTDVLDSQWIQTLPSYGLLNASFRPEAGQVLTSITGQTGLLIIRAIAAGERNPQQLAALRHWRCQKDEVEIAEALTGTWRDEHLFVLKQSLAMYDFYTEQLTACDQEIERTFSVIKPRGEEYRPLGAAEYEQQFKERQVQFLKRKAAKLGLELVPV